ncbi:hypothetical protein [Elstera litoralis]|nr:hypothetical protein [Elstera litoralis]
MLAMMRLTALADRRIDQLSGGQRQRVAHRPRAGRRSRRAAAR